MIMASNYTIKNVGRKEPSKEAINNFIEAYKKMIEANEEQERQENVPNTDSSWVGIGGEKIEKEVKQTNLANEYGQTIRSARTE